MSQARGKEFSNTVFLTMQKCVQPVNGLMISLTALIV